MSIHFAIALPTYNRLDYLKRALESIEQQNIPEYVCLSVIISNIGSTDGTYEFLEQINSSKSSGSGINYVITNKQPQPDDDTSCVKNFESLGLTIPDQVDWVWFLGDDDYLLQKNSVSIVTQVIKDHAEKDLKLVHACQGRRSQSSGKVVIGTTLGLCNTIGYHELLGWISSLVMCRTLATEVLTNCGKNSENIHQNHDDGHILSSAYPHSAAILRSIHAQNAAFIDFPLAEPQDQNQTAQSMERWAEENMGERYFFVIDDLERIQTECGLGKFSRQFFRYLTYHFWDIYISHQIKQVLNPNVSPEQKQDETVLKNREANWQRLGKLQHMLADTFDQKHLNHISKTNFDLCHLYELNGFENKSLEDLLIQNLHIVNRQVYDFKIMQP